MDCLLCKLEKKTHWYFECALFIVCDCQTCKVPMYVWRKHEFLPTVREQRKMYKDAKQRFPNKKIDLVRRSISDHFHFHMR